MMVSTSGIRGSINDLFLDLSPTHSELVRIQRIHKEALKRSVRSSIASSVAVRHVPTRFPVIDAACITRVES